MKQIQRGFTLIELVMVIVILGILAAVALPKYVDLSTQALTAAKAGMSGAVKSTHVVLVAQNAANGSATPNPTLTALAAGMMPQGVVKTDFSGINVRINETTYTVPTFTVADCTGAPAAASDQIACVGSIP